MVQAHCEQGRHRNCKKPCRSEEHTSELQSRSDLVCRLLLEKKKKNKIHAEARLDPAMDRRGAKCGATGRAYDADAVEAVQRYAPRVPRGRCDQPLSSRYTAY